MDTFFFILCRFFNQHHNMFKLGTWTMCLHVLSLHFNWLHEARWNKWATTNLISKPCHKWQLLVFPHGVTNVWSEVVVLGHMNNTVEQNKGCKYLGVVFLPRLSWDSQLGTNPPFPSPPSPFRKPTKHFHNIFGMVPKLEKWPTALFAIDLWQSKAIGNIVVS